MSELMYTFTGILPLVSVPQALMILSMLLAASYYMKRQKWSVLKSRKIAYRASNY